MTRKQGYNPLNTIPMDIVAKRVVFDDGDHYDPKIKSNTHCYSTLPLPFWETKDLPLKVRCDPLFEDLTGAIFGNFTVMGLLKGFKYDKWVLRCCCGAYEVRRTKTLRKITGKIDQTRCQSCLDSERLSHREYYKKHGIYPWQEERK